MTALLTYTQVNMNRLKSLKELLPGNLEAIAKAGDSKLLVMLYGDGQNASEWLRENHQDAVDEGLLDVAEYFGNAYFHRSHSCNLANLATDTPFILDISGETYITEAAAQEMIETVHREKDGAPWWAYAISALMPKDVFIYMGGYDESFVGYGHEDTDLCDRLKVSGIREVRVKHGPYGGPAWDSTPHLTRTRNYPGLYGDTQMTNLTNQQRAKDRKPFHVGNYRRTWGEGLVLKNWSFHVRCGAYSFQNGTSFVRNEFDIPEEAPGVYDMTRDGVSYPPVALLKGGAVNVNGRPAGEWSYHKGALTLALFGEPEPETFYQEQQGCLSTLDGKVVIDKR